MLTTRRTRGRAVSALLALALFLAGSNYCLLGALAGPGSRLGCGMTAAPAAAPVPACHAHAAKAAPGAPSPKHRAAPMPCCLAFAPVVAPDATSLAPAAAADAPPALVPEGAPTALPAIAWVGHAPCAGAGPPGDPPASSSEARAPPLA